MHQNCIIFSSLFYTSDKQESDNEQVFNSLIDELKLLQTEGILIKHVGVETRVKFQPVLMLGDNLGLNGCYGFIESYTANFYCRICKASSEQCKKMVEEHVSLLRNRLNYAIDVVTADAKKTGIKEVCVFHNLYDFHITENVCVDLMYDFLGGVAYYVLKSLLETFIFKTKYFTLYNLNSRIQSFNFSLYNMNKPSVIRMDQTSLNLKCSASEMMSLVTFLGIIISNTIPQSDKHWNLYKYLCEIYDIVMSPRFVSAHTELLKDSIKQLNELYLNIYGHLKPKFHNMTHYPRIILDNGPPTKFWTARFESYYQGIKSNAHSPSNTRNLIKTIAIKQSLRLENLKYLEIIFGNIIKKFQTKDYFEKIEIHGISYEIGSFIVTNLTKSEKQFGKILSLSFVNDAIYFKVNLFEEISYDEHIHAYIIENLNENRIIKYENIPVITPLIPYIVENNYYLIAKYYYY